MRGIAFILVTPCASAYPITLLVLSLAAEAYPARAQEAEKTVSQYVKAAGGSKTLSKIQTLTLEGTFNTDDGKAGTYTLDTKLPNRYYSELLVGDKNLIEAYNGKSAWHQTAAGELGTLVGPEGMQLEAAAQFYNSRLLNPKKSKMTLTLVGHAQVRGKDAVQLEVTSATGMKRQVFFDPQTHLIVKEAATVGGIEEEILYDDYRTVDGVKLPYKIELHRGSDKYDIDVTRAVINGTVGERVFDFPIKSQVKLPDLKALFKEIDDNQKAIDKLKENYAGSQWEEETEFEGDGRVKKREVHEYTFFYLNGEEITTLVKKDGKALSAEEQKKENEKTQKRIEEIQKREAKKEAKEEKAKEEGKKDENDEPGIEIFLRASPVCESAPRTLPRAGRAGLRFRAESRIQGAQAGGKGRTEARGRRVDRREGPRCGAAGSIFYRGHEICRRLAGQSAKGHELRLRASLCEQRGMAADLPGGARGSAGPAGEGVQGRRRDALLRLQKV